jgi:hypothetical protein
MVKDVQRHARRAAVLVEQGLLKVRVGISH